MINVHRFQTFLKQKILNKIKNELSHTLQDNLHYIATFTTIADWSALICHATCIYTLYKHICLDSELTMDVYTSSVWQEYSYHGTHGAQNYIAIREKRTRIQIYQLRIRWKQHLNLVNFFYNVNIVEGEVVTLQR